MRLNDSEPIYTEHDISENKALTPEGFLLCRDVCISRPGRFRYRADEADIPSDTGIVWLSRSREELFKPETVASFNGKPVVIGHEAGFVNPSNFKSRAVGTVQNVREEEGKLVADLLITDDEAIRLIQSGELREVSCGFDAECVPDGPGAGHQEGIVGNHVALVTKARLGSECQIKDGFMSLNSLKKVLRRAFKDGDDAGFENILANIKEEETPVEDSEPAAVSPEQSQAQGAEKDDEFDLNLEEQTDAAPEAPERDPMTDIVARLDRLEKLLMKLVPQEPMRDAEPDQVGLNPMPEPSGVDSLEAEQTFDDAEEIAPGFDRPRPDLDNGRFSERLMDSMKQKALRSAGCREFGDANTLSGRALDIAFRAAVIGAKKAKNPAYKPVAFGDSAVDCNTIEAIQARADAFWGNR